MKKLTVKSLACFFLMSCGVHAQTSTSSTNSTKEAVTYRCINFYGYDSYTGETNSEYNIYEKFSLNTEKLISMKTSWTAKVLNEVSADGWRFVYTGSTDTLCFTK